MGSPRINGNTAELLKPVVAELENNDHEVSYITLSDKEILPCKGCYACQQVKGEYGCDIVDDVNKIMDEIIISDCVIFATPIYTWYCTAPMKALLDRHYGLNKFYGIAAPGSLWENKKIAIIATHGYDADYAASPFETGIIRLCEHSNLEFIGMFSVRDEDDLASFQTKSVITGAKVFAKELISKTQNKKCN